jgi:hypothetical protein
MVTIEDADAMASALDEVTEELRQGDRTWFVAVKAFMWERPFSKADRQRQVGRELPDGPILALRVEDLDEKEAALAAHPKSFFTISHFDRYAVVLIQLNVATKKELKPAILDAWLASAPPRLSAPYLR